MTSWLVDFQGPSISNRKVTFQPSIFRGHVKLRGCMQNTFSLDLLRSPKRVFQQLGVRAECTNISTAQFHFKCFFYQYSFTIHIQPYFDHIYIYITTLLHHISSSYNFTTNLTESFYYNFTILYYGSVFLP